MKEKRQKVKNGRVKRQMSEISEMMLGALISPVIVNGFLVSFCAHRPVQTARQPEHGR